MKSNGIAQRQNADYNIARLAAERQLYNDAGALDRLNVFLSVIIPLGFASLQEIATGWYWAKTASCCLSIAMLIISLVISSQGKSKKKTAATIQQEFDVDVFQMPWDDKLFDKRRDLNGEVAEHAKKILNDDREKQKLYNWYRAEVDGFPLNEAIIICQKENASWDGRLRKRYRLFLMILIALIIIVPVVICLVNGESVQDLIFKFVMVLPALRWLTNIVVGLNEDLKRMESLESSVFSTEDKTMTELQFIQKGIFEHRKSAVKIPSWFYHRFKENDEDREKRIVALSKSNSTTAQRAAK